MQIEFKHDPEQTEPKLTITAAGLTDEIADLLRRLEHGRPGAVTAFQDERVFLLRPEDILRFYAEDKGVRAQTAEKAYAVRERLYELDRSYALRFSHENPAVGDLYKNYLGAPLSHRAHELLHTEQEEWEL